MEEEQVPAEQALPEPPAPQVVVVHGGAEEHLETVVIPKPPVHVRMFLNRQARRRMAASSRKARQVPGAHGRPQ